MSQTHVVDANPSKWGVWAPIVVLVAAFVAYLFLRCNLRIEIAFVVGGFVLTAVVFLCRPAVKHLSRLPKRLSVKPVKWFGRLEKKFANGGCGVPVCVCDGLVYSGC